MRIFLIGLVIGLNYLFCASEIFAQTSEYPLDICIVDENVLGSQGKVEEYMYRGTLIYFCKAACIDVFNKNPEKFIGHIMNPQAYKANIAKKIADAKAKEDAAKKAKAEADKKAKEEAAKKAQAEKEVVEEVNSQQLNNLVIVS